MPLAQAHPKLSLMNLPLLTKELLARTLVEPMLRSGKAPFGPFNPLMAWVLKNRDARLPKDHPLKSLEDIREWDSTFALSRSSLLWLWAKLNQLKPIRILEFGSGRTTFALASYAKQCREAGLATPIIITVEAEGTWLAQTREILASHHLESFITFIQANAIKTPTDHGYDLDETSLREAFQSKDVEFLLIDGPSGGHGRIGTLRSVFDLLSPDAVIFLDDCDRAAEKHSIRAWAKDYGSKIQSHGIIPTVGGLGWLTRTAR